MDARFVPAGIVSGILIIISLVITFLQQIIGLIAFLMTAVKLTMIFGFIGLMLFIGLLAFRTFRERRREKE
jgi:hypothetical protein